MTVLSYTANYKFALIDYASRVWHDDEYANWNLLDGILTAQGTQVPFVVATGAVNTYVGTYAPAIGALTPGLTLSFLTNAANTGSATLNPNGLGAKTLKFAGANLVAGDLPNASYVKVVYDGTNFQVVEPHTRALIVRAQTMLENVAALTATAVDASIGTVYLSNYATTGDGGGHHKSRTGPGAGPGKQQDASGNWWIIDELTYRPEMLGALGDGATNDYTAINQAVFLAPGKAIELMNKTYRIGTTLALSVPINIHGVVAGRNNGTTYGSCIKTIGAINAFTIDISAGPSPPVVDEHSGKFSDFIIDGAGAGLVGVQILADRGATTAWHFSGMTVTGFATSGFNPQEGAGIVLQNCVTSQCGSAASVLTGGYVLTGGEVTLIGCVARGNLGCGVVQAGAVTSWIGGTICFSNLHGMHFLANKGNTTVVGTSFNNNSQAAANTYNDINHAANTCSNNVFENIVSDNSNMLKFMDIRGANNIVRNCSGVVAAKLLYRATSGLFEGNVSQLDATSSFNGSHCVNTAANYATFASPAIAASTVAVTNAVTAGPMEVRFLTAGTVTVVTVTYPNASVFTHTGAAFVGLTFFLPPGATIAITYTVAPTWQWISRPFL